jgi:Alw26I/Eco31I/Esp3I family type II restriction m6 adenine DNA methyltransferase
LERERLESSDFVLPIAFGGQDHFRELLELLPTFGGLEEDENGLWAGRELDESHLASKLGSSGRYPFIKGRMIQRFAVVEAPGSFVRATAFSGSASVAHERIAWRDVTRNSQKRRIIATIIPATWVAGNSLGVAYFRREEPYRLRALLGLMMSFPFEYQLRSLLSTGHVSLSTLRKIHLPSLVRTPTLSSLVKCVDRCIGGDAASEASVEAAAAAAYGLSRNDLAEMMALFPRVTPEERRHVLDEFDHLERSVDVGVAEKRRARLARSI